MECQILGFRDMGRSSVLAASWPAPIVALAHRTGREVAASRKVMPGGKFWLDRGNYSGVGRNLSARTYVRVLDVATVCHGFGSPVFRRVLNRARLRANP